MARALSADYRPVPLVYERPSPEEALARSREFAELMDARRSVRRFSSEPVPWELVENALRVAGTAPSGAHQQPWTFVVVSDPETKQKLREAAEHEERLLYEERASDEYLSALEPIGTDSVKTHITDAPYVIVVFEQAWGMNPDGTKRKHYYVRESVGIATGLLLASLHAAGLATLTHSPSPMGFLKKILGRPENERPFVLIPVGYPAPDAEIPEFAIWEKPFEEVSEFVD
jgi:nitroreductase